MNVQEWLRNLEAAHQTKGHIKAVIHRLYKKAMLWEMVDWHRHPMELVKIKGISKRRKCPVILTVEQFFLLLPLIPQPYRTMVLLAQCSGLRVEKVLAVEKPDIHFETSSMQIVREVVHGRVTQEERWNAAGKYGSIGGHTFRHTYRSWLDDTGAPVGVQQKLMRHAQISTTMTSMARADGVQAGSQYGCRKQALQKGLNPRSTNPKNNPTHRRRKWSSYGGLSGLTFSLSGCGGRI